MCALQHVHCAAQVIQGRGIPTEPPQRQAAPVQHTPHQHAAGQAQSLVECGESGRGLACISKCQSQRGQHISFSFGGTGLAGQAQCGAQLTDSRIDITGIAQNNSGGLMSN